MSRLNQILLVLLGAQIVGLAVGRATTSESPAQKTVDLFAGLDADKVTKLEIVGAAPAKEDDPPQNKVILAKKDGKWGVSDADDYPVDKAKVDELLKTLATLRTRNRVLDSATYHAKLEVAADKFQRKLTVTSGDDSSVMYFGSAPRFKNVHVRQDGEDAVYLLNDFGTSELGDRAWNWVDREYIKYPADDVWQVKVKNAKGEIQLDKDPVSKQWAMLGTDKTLDTSAVSDLVRKASNVNLETPVGNTVKPEFGLSEATATITLVTGTSTVAGAPPPSTETVTWSIGKKIESDNQHYVKAATNPYVVKVAGWGVQPLIEKSAADLIKKEGEEKKDEDK